MARGLLSFRSLEKLVHVVAVASAADGVERHAGLSRERRIPIRIPLDDERAGALVAQKEIEKELAGRELLIKA